MDALKTAFMPNAMCIDGGIPPTSHFCPMCGQQFERAQFIVEHMQICHSVITGIGNPGILVPAQALGRNLSDSDAGEDAPQSAGTANANTGSSFLARCMACGIYGISTATLQQGSEYKCLHCGTVCTAGQPTYLEPHEEPHTPDDMPSIPPAAMNSYGNEQNRQHHRSQQDTRNQLQPQHQNDNKNQQAQQLHQQQQQQQKDDALKVPPLTVKLSKGGEGQPRVIVKQETVGTENGSPLLTPVIPLTTKPRNKCPDCPKTFKTAGTLNIHRKVHTGETDSSAPKERPFTCSYCSKAFTQSNTLKQHTRIHTGEKPYSCNYCEKSFSVKDYLTKHIRTHTGEKPYTCPYCNKSFTQRSALTVHTTKLHPL